MATPVLFVGPLERVLHVKTHPALAGLGSRELAAVAQHARERHFTRGAVLLSRDERAEAFFLLVKGRVELRSPGNAPSVVSAGSAIAFLELLARSGAGLEARALGSGLALELDWQAQLDVCEEHFPVLLEYVRYVAAGGLRELERLPDGTWLARHEPVVAPGRPLNLVERILTLRQAKAFSTGSIDALAELARACSELRCSAGEPLWRCGDPSSFFLLVAAGTVTCTTADGRRLHQQGSALAVGLNEAVIGEPRWNDAVARSELVALRIDLGGFLDALEEHFDLAVDFLSVMARRLMELRDRAASGDPATGLSPAAPRPPASGP
jgi:CRP-like cAMP-binding protein